MSSRPKILYLTPHCPHAPSYGAQIRSLHIGRLLQRCGDVLLTLLLNGDSPAQNLDQTREEFGHELLYRCDSAPIRGLSARLRHEFDPAFINTDGWALSSLHVQRLEQLIREHDVVWVHGMLAANNAGLARWPHSVLDLDDVQSQFHKSACRGAGSLKGRILSARRYWLWKRREARLLNRFNVLAVCSEADKTHLGGSDRIHTIPNGYGTSATEPLRAPATPKRVGFIGTLKYPPNREGVKWFIQRVWPAVQKEFPDARLRLVGDQTDSEITKLGANIDGLGRVEDAAAEIATWSLTVVPVRSGGGTRIKIAESFSRKCPVVATHWGAFGYEVKSGEELFLADAPAEFARACNSILSDPSIGEQLAARAWNKYVNSWTWSAIAPKVEAAVEHSLALSRTSSGDNVACPVVAASTVA